MILKEFKRKITIAHSTRKCPRPKIIILRLRVVQSYMKQMVKEMPWMKKKSMTTASKETKYGTQNSNLVSHWIIKAFSN